MPTEVPRINYYQAAQDYLRRLPLEHFMEATPQGTQREITLVCLGQVKVRRPDLHVFNELLVQYRLPRRKRPGQVVPDNLVVLHDGPIKAEGSYDVPLQPAGPFWVLEYVSKSSKRKDYEDNREHYEKHLKVPYYLLFYPEAQELTLLHHTGEKYVSVKPNVYDRLAIPELEMEVALLDGWVRFWFRGELLPLAAEWQGKLDEAQRARHAAEEEAVRSQRARRTAEEERDRLRAELEELKRQQSNK